MTGSVLQLQAKGEEDEYITGNPLVSFFKYSYRKHTNFSMEPFELLFQDHVTWGKHTYCTIPRNGDLLSRAYLQIKLPKLSGTLTNNGARWVTNVGHVLIDFVEVTIGGQTIDKQTGEWMYIYNQLSSPGGKRNGLDYMIGYDVDPFEEKIIYIPLTFWFNSQNGVALPLVALQFHEIKIKVGLKNFSDVTIGATTEVPIKSLTILADYVFLDRNERLQLVNKKQEYLIDQVQINKSNSSPNILATIDLMFKNPVKELVWVVQRSDKLEPQTRDWFNFSFRNNINPVKNVVLQCNGENRLTDLPGEYFNLVQPYQHHSNIPENPGICVYSFAVQPESYQPSGSFNFSKLDHAELHVELFPDYFDNPQSSYVVADIRVYAISHNILVIENGEGGILFPS